MHGNIQ